jgi:hypothetical protein
VDYSQEISASLGLPTAVVFLVDQSGSMGDPWPQGKGSKADEVADIINKAIDGLIISCQKGNDMRDYFEVLGVGYSGTNAKDLWGSGFLPVSQLKGMGHTETRRVTMYIGAGQNQEVDTDFTVWVESAADGGTPMADAFALVHRELSAWIAKHPDSFPPIVFNITDAQAQDQPGAVAAAQHVAALRTSDGNVLVANCHISETAGQPVTFPSTDAGLPDDWAKFLYSLSSPLPPKMLSEAKRRLEGQVQDGARGYLFNAGPSQLVTLLDIGTKTQKDQQADR